MPFDAPHLPAPRARWPRLLGVLLLGLVVSVAAATAARALLGASPLADLAGALAFACATLPLLARAAPAVAPMQPSALPPPVPIEVQEGPAPPTPSAPAEAAELQRYREVADILHGQVDSAIAETEGTARSLIRDLDALDAAARALTTELAEAQARAAILNEDGRTDVEQMRGAMEALRAPRRPGGADRVGPRDLRAHRRGGRGLRARHRRYRPHRPADATARAQCHHRGRAWG
jgi:hypothetical protein